MSPLFKRLTSIVAIGIGCVAVARLLMAAGDSHDFDVYYQGARSWLDGSNPYEVHPELPGMVFKYPPWIIPLFAPFVALSLGGARGVWAALELGALIFSIRWVARQGAGWTLALLAAAPLWWIWLGHFHAGQVTLPLLALGLWAFDRRHQPLFVAGALFFWSSKVFSILTFAGLRGRAWGLRPIAGALTLTAFAHLPLLVGATSLSQLYEGWWASAASGGTELGSQVVRGPANHGITALLLRTIGVPAAEARADIVAALGVFVLLGAAWNWGSKRARLTEAEAWTGWLAVGLLAHPLAWHHSFVLAYPLAGLALARARRERHLEKTVWMGLACIGLLLPQTLGTVTAQTLEVFGLKACGVILCAAALAWPVRIRR